MACFWRWVSQAMQPPFRLPLRQEQRALIRREFGYPTITWNVDPEDWKRPGVGVVTKRLVEGARPRESCWPR
ncbi:MAG: hypothetical protein R3F19_09270 [Verrucomicrobiales bacterium]